MGIYISFYWLRVYRLANNYYRLRIIFYRLPVYEIANTGYGFIFYLKDITGNDIMYYCLSNTVYGSTKYLLSVNISCVSFYLLWNMGLDILYYLISNTGHWLRPTFLKASSSELATLSAYTPPWGRPFTIYLIHHDC
jgi:hypothetical protein